MVQIEMRRDDLAHVARSKPSSRTCEIAVSAASGARAETRW